MLHSTRTPLPARVSDAAGEALATTAQAIDSGRQFATEAAGSIGDAARHGAASVSDAAGAAQRQVGRYASAARDYVAEEPLKSALISAAVGAAAAWLLMAILRNRSDRE